VTDSDFLEIEGGEDAEAAPKPEKKSKKTSSKRKEKAEDGSLPLEDHGRQKALEATLADLTRRFGDGTVLRLGDAAHMAVEVIPTGSLTVDIATGVGGVPRGRIVEIYGPESSGKTTLCLHIICQAQKRGGLCAFVDMEHALDPAYAERIGVNVDTLYISQPDTGEQALEITEAFVRSGAVDVVVVDSVAALVPRAEIEGEMGDAFVGLQARLMSQALRKLSGAIKQSNVTVLFTNQLREKVGVMFGCFAADTPVMLADGTTEQIGNIVAQKMDVEVVSYNVLTGEFEPRRVVNWFDNGETDTFLQFTVASHDGVHEFKCTPNHMILTDSGYEAAEDLKVGDLLMTAVPLPELAMAGGAEPYTAPSANFEPVGMPILDIQRVVPTVDNHRYDIEVEGNHCYVVDGVVVHNSPETTSGGRALKFYASVRLDIRRIQSIKQGGDTIGNRTKVRVTKNKVAAPFREAEFDIMFFEGGISKAGEIVDLGVELGIIDKRGAFFRYNDGLLGQGREASKQFLDNNPAVSDEIEDAIRAHFSLPPTTQLPK